MYTFSVIKLFDQSFNLHDVKSQHISMKRIESMKIKVTYTNSQNITRWSPPQCFDVPGEVKREISLENHNSNNEK